MKPETDTKVGPYLDKFKEYVNKENWARVITAFGTIDTLITLTAYTAKTGQQNKTLFGTLMLTAFSATLAAFGDLAFRNEQKYRQSDKIYSIVKQDIFEQSKQLKPIFQQLSENSLAEIHNILQNLDNPDLNNSLRDFNPEINKAVFDAVQSAVSPDLPPTSPSTPAT